MSAYIQRGGKSFECLDKYYWNSEDGIGGPDFFWGWALINGPLIAQKLCDKDAELSRLKAEYERAENERIEWVKRGERAEAECLRLTEERRDMEEQRDSALVKWHGHQKNVPCAGCEGGHDTYWGTVIKSDQWKAWEESRPCWDVDECRECGHISQEHFQAFLKFAALQKSPSVEAGVVDDEVRLALKYSDGKVLATAYSQSLKRIEELTQLAANYEMDKHKAEKERDGLRAVLDIGDRLVTMMFVKNGYLAHNPEVYNLHVDFVQARSAIRSLTESTKAEEAK